MATDTHGNQLQGFFGKEVKGSLCGQTVKLMTDQAQWLADMGYEVSIRGKDGKMVVVEGRTQILEPLQIPQDNPEVVEFFERRAEQVKRDSFI